MLVKYLSNAIRTLFVVYHISFSSRSELMFSMCRYTNTAAKFLSYQTEKYTRHGSLFEIEIGTCNFDWSENPNVVYLCTNIRTLLFGSIWSIQEQQEQNLNTYLLKMPIDWRPLFHNAELCTSTFHIFADASCIIYYATNDIGPKHNLNTTSVMLNHIPLWI